MKQKKQNPSKRPRPSNIQRKSSADSTQSDRDVLTIIQQDDQELAEAKLRAAQHHHQQQQPSNNRPPSPNTMPPLQPAETTGRDIVTILQQDDQELAEAKARARTKQPKHTTSAPATSKPKPEETPPPSKAAKSMNDASSLAFLKSKEEAKNTAPIQYSNRQQALAANLAFRESQQDESAMDDMIAEEQKVEEESGFFDDHQVLIDGTSDHHPFTRGGGPADPLVHHNTTNNSVAPSQPGAFRVEPTTGNTDDTAPEEDISWGDPENPSAEQHDGTHNMDGTEKEEEDDDEEEETRSHHSTNETGTSTLPNSDGDILVEATLVSAEAVDLEKEVVKETVVFPEPELVTAERMSETFTRHDMIKSKYGRRWILGVLALVLSVLIIASIIIGVLVRRNKNDTQPTEAPTMAPTSFFDDALPLVTQEAIEAGNHTPQAMAYEWYLDDQAYERPPEDPNNIQTFVPIQRFALATLYQATNGVGWLDHDHWMEHEMSECNWFSSFYGSICSSGPQNRRRRHLRRELQSITPPQYYNRLSLNSNNLTGSLTPEISLLSNLDVLNIHGHPNLVGTIPTEFGLFRHVTLLQLFQNQLTGTIPTEMGLLPKVVQFNLAFNQLTGTIPTELAQLSNSVISLSVSNNPLEGVLPTELGALSDLQEIYFYNNPNLTGPIPTEFGNLTSLKKMQLNGANWTSTLPSEIGLLDNSLQEIYLQDNWQLEGTIPTEWGHLTRLTQLRLHNTNLSGVVPRELCNMLTSGRLQSLSVDCDRVLCGCECDCSKSWDPTGEETTSSPQEYDSIDGGEMTTTAPISFSCPDLNTTNTSEKPL